jgi:hypothetical protein
MVDGMREVKRCKGCHVGCPCPTLNILEPIEEGTPIFYIDWDEKGDPHKYPVCEGEYHRYQTEIERGVLGVGWFLDREDAEDSLTKEGDQV